MVQKVKLSRKLKSPQALDQTPVEGDPAGIVERPDGYYWQALVGRQEFGPFETYELAQTDRDALSEEALAPLETMHMAEQEIGIANWIDPDTGEPAEGESPPHLPGE